MVRHGLTLHHIGTGRNGCLLFLLIVFILTFRGRWKTGALLWITQIAQLLRHDSASVDVQGDVWGRVLIGPLGRATGSRKKDRRLKEKTVVPVVRLGKVETLPKRLCAMDLMVCLIF
jgi:hypothetical protein